MKLLSFLYMQMVINTLQSYPIYVNIFGDLENPVSHTLGGEDCNGENQIFQAQIFNVRLLVQRSKRTKCLQTSYGDVKCQTAFHSLKKTVYTTSSFQFTFQRTTNAQQYFTYMVVYISQHYDIVYIYVCKLYHFSLVLFT